MSIPEDIRYKRQRVISELDAMLTSIQREAVRQPGQRRYHRDIAIAFGPGDTTFIISIDVDDNTLAPEIEA